MSDRIIQSIKADPGAAVTVIGTQYVGAEPPVETLDELLKRSRLQCAATRNRVGRKYLPELYAQRAADAEAVQMLSENRRPTAAAMVLIERAGSGKTNLFCRLSETLPAEGTPMLFLLGSDLNPNVSLAAHCCRLFRLPDAATERAEEIIDRLVAPSGKRFAVLIDAINEVRDVDALKAFLLDGIAWLRAKPVTFLLSCRDVYWSFVNGEWTENLAHTRLWQANLYHYEEDVWPTVRERHLRAYRIDGLIEGDADLRCRHPLLFRFFCEAYEGESIATLRHIRLRPLFERYLARKIERVAREGLLELRAREKIEQALRNLAWRMIERKETSIVETDVAEVTGDREYLARHSVYVRLLDEDLIIEQIPERGSKTLKRRVRFVYEAFFEFMLALALEAEWAESSSDHVVSALERLLEPSACMRNVIGSIQFLTKFFAEREIEVWKIFTSRGPAWENMGISILAEIEIDALQEEHRAAFLTFVRSGSVDTRVAALRLLENPGRRRALGLDAAQLLETFETDPHAAVRAEAARQLANGWTSLEKTARSRLVKAAFDRSVLVRKPGVSLFRARYRSSPREAVRQLSDALNSSSGRTRSFALLAINLTPWPEARPLLLGALQDEFHWCRTAALMQLRAHPVEADADAIATLLDDPITRVRALAADVCGSWKFSVLATRLTARLEVESDPKILSRLLAALSEISPAESVALFRRRLADADPWVMRMAGRGLLQALGVAAVDELVETVLRHEMLEWPGLWKISEVFPAASLRRTFATRKTIAGLKRSTSVFVCGLLLVEIAIGSAKEFKQIKPRFDAQLTKIFGLMPSEEKACFLEGLGRVYHGSRFMELKQSRALREVLQDALRDPDERVRAAAVQVAIVHQFLCPPELWARLMTNDPPRVRRYFARALAKHPNLSVLPVQQNETVAKSLLKSPRWVTASLASEDAEYLSQFSSDRDRVKAWAKRRKKINRRDHSSLGAGAGQAGDDDAF